MGRLKKHEKLEGKIKQKYKAITYINVSYCTVHFIVDGGTVMLVYNHSPHELFRVIDFYFLCSSIEERAEYINKNNLGEIC